MPHFVCTIVVRLLYLVFHANKCYIWAEVVVDKDTKRILAIECFLNPNEELLGMRSNLSSRSRTYMFLYFFPFLAE